MYTTPLVSRHNRPHQFVIHRPQRNVVVPLSTDLSALRGAHVLFLGDVENMVISAKNIGFNLDLVKVGTAIGKVAKRASLHAFWTQDRTTGEMTDILCRKGWKVHERAGFNLNGRLHRNSDGRILIEAGVIISRTQPDIVLCGSGDGGLVLELGSFIESLRRKVRPRLMTLSLAGATNRSLDARYNSMVAANLEIGRDLTTTWR